MLSEKISFNDTHQREQIAHQIYKSFMMIIIKIRFVGRWLQLRLAGLIHKQIVIISRWYYDGVASEKENLLQFDTLFLKIVLLLLATAKKYKEAKKMW